jgi:hypothetical protein
MSVPDPEDPDTAAELILARAEIAAIDAETSVCCEACGRRFTVPRGRGWRNRRYCDTCREDGTAGRVRRMRQGTRYREAAEVIERLSEAAGTADAGRLPSDAWHTRVARKRSPRRREWRSA